MSTESDKVNKYLSQLINQLGDSRIGWVDETINIGPEDEEISEEDVMQHTPKYVEYMFEKVEDAIIDVRQALEEDGQDDKVEEILEYGDPQEVMVLLDIVD